MHLLFLEQLKVLIDSLTEPFIVAGDFNQQYPRVARANGDAADALDRELLLEHSPRFLTAYENQASSAESTNRWLHKAPVSLRRGPEVWEIRRDQARKASERRARIFAEHEWVEVPNAHPLSDSGLATEPVDADFDPTSSNELFESRRIRQA